MRDTSITSCFVPNHIHLLGCIKLNQTIPERESRSLLWHLQRKASKHSIQYLIELLQDANFIKKYFQIYETPVDIV